MAAGSLHLLGGMRGTGILLAGDKCAAFDVAQTAVPVVALGQQGQHPLAGDLDALVQVGEGAGRGDSRTRGTSKRLQA